MNLQKEIINMIDILGDARWNEVCKMFYIKEDKPYSYFDSVSEFTDKLKEVNWLHENDIVDSNGTIIGKTFIGDMPGLVSNIPITQVSMIHDLMIVSKDEGNIAILKGVSRPLCQQSRLITSISDKGEEYFLSLNITDYKECTYLDKTRYKEGSVIKQSYAWGTGVSVVKIV